jgi:CTP:molybdopterin cytidylyltransferase MocA
VGGAAIRLVFAQCYFDELTGLGDDRGARTILAKNANRIVEIPVDDASAWHDVDTVDDLVTARQLFNRNFP